MRVWLAIAAILAAGTAAGARELIRDCSADADANGLRGQARVHFLARCRAEARATRAYGDIGGRRQPAYCAPPVNNVADVLVGTCIPCVLFVSIFPNDGRCYGP
jgi:hypothetical protein